MSTFIAEIETICKTYVCKEPAPAVKHENAICSDRVHRFTIECHNLAVLIANQLVLERKVSGNVKCGVW